MKTVRTPGRLCLFGEHQDYLGLPVIAQGMPLYSFVSGEVTKGNDRRISIHLPNLDKTEYIFLDDLERNAPHTLFEAGMKVCMQAGLQYSSSIKVEVKSDIPPQAGCSSSSSIMVGWIRLLTKLADEPVQWKPREIAEAAYQAEVVILKSHGGRMDQYTTAINKLIYMESEPKLSIQYLPAIPGEFVLGDSREPKDTQLHLKRNKENRVEMIQRLKNEDPDFSIHRVQYGEVNEYNSLLSIKERELLSGTIRNRDILRDAHNELISSSPNYEGIGELLTEEHAILRDVLHVSTPKIDHLLDVSRDAGAVGGKINGSGGGGCMFVYAPDCQHDVAKAIEKAGGRAYIFE
ncbi:MAG: GHMP kinase [Candidatus Marinimicrobia bacterium]|nr:GHMP kinase [Candidatus Neomarinimicrobiota bacterium]